MQKRLQEITARKAEIQTELKTADEKRIAELNTDADTLIAEETQLRAKNGSIRQTQYPGAQAGRTARYRHARTEAGKRTARKARRDHRQRDAGAAENDRRYQRPAEPAQFHH